jgi:DNA helicase II / ATP-dependent DNA helicase PcrA
MINKRLTELNESQRAAAITVDGPLLILAGAGSGKTKTITTRLAYLLSLGIDPANTLTLTFTNKAAEEMRHRAMSMIESAMYPPLLCTFHKFGLIFLRFHITKLNRENSFSVIDTDDKKRIIKPFCKDVPASTAAHAISGYKNEILSPEDVRKIAKTEQEAEISAVYAKYEEYIATNNLVDFDDLLLLPYRILAQNETVATETSQKYQYIMVDEYQDTNSLQFELLRKLCHTHNNLCVVGDDDQSIYSFRGAKVENILSFETTFKDTKVVKLEENYRSSSNILDIANLVISNNKNRYEKKLKATRENMEAVGYKGFADEKEEATWIASTIKELIKKGEKPSSIAVLFRVNAVSRAIEEGFRAQNLGYVFVGGMKFYERIEIRDAIAYLRLAVNPNDEFSLQRVINKPKRGIGKTSIEKLEALCQKAGVKTIELLSSNFYNDALLQAVGKNTFAQLKKFVSIVEELKELNTKSTFSLLEEFENIVGLKKFFLTLPGEEERAANLDEFYGSLKEYFKANPEQDIEEYLNDISIQSDVDTAEFGNDVSIMTVHASKGLEYKTVFVVAMEEGFFPVANERTDIEEERRLCYVAFTRAKDKLYISSSRSRFVYGKRDYSPVSRFLKEAGLTDAPIAIKDSTAAFVKNDLVKHKIFGFGRVLEVTKVGKELKLKINFGGSQRDILASFVEKAV